MCSVFGFEGGFSLAVLIMYLLLIIRLKGCLVWTEPSRIFSWLGAGLGLIYCSIEAVYQRLDEAPVSLYLCAHFCVDGMVLNRFLKFSGLR